MVLLKRLVLVVLMFGVLIGCSDRKGLETGEKLYAHYCISCHQNSGDAFISNIRTGVLTRRSSLTVSRTIQDDSAHGSKKVKALNEISDKESQKLVKYLYQLKIEYETDGKITSLK